MFFKRFYDHPLAQASYMIGCQRSGEALVVDPSRDIQQYIDAAQAERLRITHVSETHIHADFVSGARELAARAAARLLLSREGGADWQYAYATQDGATLVGSGDSFHVGNIRIDVMHTPGHTPEHISFLVTDVPASDAPWGFLTGDFVFVGDVGRPDLLERAAGHANTMEASARSLFASLQRFRALPDHVQVWPGHGAGSACGKALGAVPSSTVGYEKVANWGVAELDEASFVRSVLAGQPEPPAYFAQMKRINREGPAIVGDAPGLPPSLDAARFDELLQAGATLVDTRSAAVYATGYIPGTLNIPYNAAFTGWAGWLLPYNSDVHLIVDENETQSLPRLLAGLRGIGIDRVAGVFASSIVLSGRRLESVPQADPDAIAPLLEHGVAHVIDVRGRTEYESGHIPGAVNIPVGHLSSKLAELPLNKPIVLQCQAGARSAIAASVLRAHGIHNVVNLTGGIAAWQNAGLPVMDAR